MGTGSSHHDMECNKATPWTFLYLLAMHIRSAPFCLPVWRQADVRDTSFEWVCSEPSWTLEQPSSGESIGCRWEARWQACQHDVLFITKDCHRRMLFCALSLQLHSIGCLQERSTFRPGGPCTFAFPLNMQALSKAPWPRGLGVEVMRLPQFHV